MLDRISAKLYKLPARFGNLGLARSRITLWSGPAVLAALAAVSTPSRCVATTYDNATFAFSTEFVRITDAGEGYSRIRYDGTDVDRVETRAGAPELPILSKWFILPDHTTIRDLAVTTSGVDTIPGRFVPLPIADRDGGDRTPDPQHYERDSVYPRSPAYVLKDHYFRGFHLAQISIYPVRYLSHKQRLVVPQRIDVAISVQPTTGSEERQIFRCLRPEGADTPGRDIRRLVLSEVENPQQLPMFYPDFQPRDVQDPKRSAAADQYDPYGAVPTNWPSTEGPPVGTVIITNNTNLNGADMSGTRNEEPFTMTSFAESYARNREGGPVVVATVDEIMANPTYAAGDVAESIRKFVFDAAQQWSTLYVLLAGDLDIVPTRRLGAPDEADHHRMDVPSDWYYVSGEADWNTNRDAWFWQDDADRDLASSIAFVGRLPLRNGDDAFNVFEKILRYRDWEVWARDKPSDEYWESALLAGGPTNSSNPASDQCGYVAAEQIFQALSANWNDDHLKRLYGDLPAPWAEDCNGTDYECFESLRDYLEGALVGPEDEAWDGDDLWDYLNGEVGGNFVGGRHIVFHIERSSIEALGRPTGGWQPADQPCTIGEGLPAWRAACAEGLEEWVDDHWKIVEPLTSAKAFSLNNGDMQTSDTPPKRVAEYSIVLSAGPWTNAIDRRSVGEALLQAPDGGAIAYLGPNQDNGADIPELVDIMDGFLQRLLGNATPEAPAGILGLAHYWGIVDSYSPVATWANRLPLLGDPGMYVWRREPGETFVEGPTISTLGDQTIEITVLEDDAYGDPIAGALVSLKQDSLAYALVSTNAIGIAKFAGFPVRDTTDIIVKVSHPDYVPASDTLEIGGSTPGFLSYAGHTISDNGAAGDGDGIVERGEDIVLHVVWQNRGANTATAPNLSLHATPSVTLQLYVNDEFRPQDVYIGALNAHPTAAVADSFRIPLTWEGLSVHEEPTATLTAEEIKVWTENSTGRYVIAASSASASADTVFSGVLRTSGGFSGVSMTGEVGYDSYYASGDSIWFSFQGDATEDRLYFYAKAADWVVLTPPDPTFNPNVAPGDTLGGNFELSITELIPMDVTLPFTATAQHNGTSYSHSDFAIQMRGSRLDLLVVELEPGGMVGGDTSMVVLPTLINRGTAEADSAIVTCRITGGTGTVTDSTSRFAAMDPGEVLTASDQIVITSADSASLAEVVYQLEVLTPLRNNRTLPVDHDGISGGGSPSPGPANVVAEPSGASIRVRWDPVSGTITGEPFERYLTYLRNGSTGADSLDLLGESRAASLFDVYAIDGERLPPLDSNGGPIEYRFAVRACSEHFCGRPSLLSVQRPWLPDHEGWPKVVPDGITTAPLVLDLDGRDAVFVAGRRIYGWWLDTGTPLRGGASYSNGLFFDPEYSHEDPDEFRAVFSEKLVRLDLYDDGPDGVAIVGNLIRAGVYAIKVEEGELEYEPNLLWKHTVGADATAPTVAALNLTGDLANEQQVIIPGNSDTLYVWMDDGDGYIEGLSPEGAFAENSTSGNLRSIAIIDGDPFSQSVSNIVQAERGGRVVAWNTPARNAGILATTKWTKQVETAHPDNYTLSTPAVGDVDGDGEPDVVVTDQSDDFGAGTIFVLDADASGTGSIEYQVSDASWVFLSDLQFGPPPRPTLACLDTDTDGLEIVVAGTQRASGGTEATEHLAHLVAIDGAVVKTSCEQQSLIPYRFGLLTSNARGSQEPIVGQLDPESTANILMASDFGDLAAWRFVDGSSDGCEPVLGWPVHFGDVAWAPVFADEGLLVASRSSLLDYLQYPNGAGPLTGGWPEYGCDRYNSGYHPGCEEALQRDQTVLAGPPISAGPNPGRAGQQVMLHLGRGAAQADVSIFDVQGRSVRTLLSGPLPQGVHSITWNGLDDRGNSVPAGVYFYQLTVDGDVAGKIRTVHLR